MTVPSPSPRRVATPSWLDLRLVLGVGLVLASVLVGAVVFARADHRVSVVVAARDLAVGTVVTAQDVRVVRAQVPARDSLYVAAPDDAVGEQLHRPVSQGELLPRAALTAPQPATTVSVPLAAGAAPELRPGQRIEIWLSSATCAEAVVLPAVTVQDVHGDTTGTFTSQGAGQDVVIRVPPDDADRVVAALAVDQGTLRAGVLAAGTTPAGTVAGSTATAQPGGLPADLARCVGRSGSP